MNAFAGTWTRREERRRAFSDVAERHLDDVYRYLLVFADATTAEDLTAQTFEKAFRSWRRFDPLRASDRTWLCRIARSVALDHFRAEARRQRREERYAAAEAVSPDLPLGFSPALADALSMLSAGEREVIALRIVLELDADAAARVLGIGRTACSMRLSRALQKLEGRMTGDRS